MSTTTLMTTSEAEVYRDGWLGRWVLTKAPEPIPMWQATSASYKGGTATLFGTSRDEVLKGITEYAEKHERLVATEELANAVVRYSAIGVSLGLLGVAAGKVRDSAPTLRGGMTVAAIGAAGVLGSLLIDRQAKINRAEKA